MTPKCRARVQMGTYTYMARTKDRPCGNVAQGNGFCHVHQRYAVTPTDTAEFNALRESLLGVARSTP